MESTREKSCPGDDEDNVILHVVHTRCCCSQRSIIPSSGVRRRGRERRTENSLRVGEIIQVENCFAAIHDTVEWIGITVADGTYRFY